MKEIVAHCSISMNRLGVFENNSLVEFYIDEPYDSSISGNIYKGRIENRVPGLDASFVNIGQKKNAFLQIDGSMDDLKNGSELLVQVIREESGDKGARVTNKLSIPGKYCVLLIDDPAINISSKIKSSERRQQLLLLGQKLQEEGYGIIFRTESYSACDEEIEREYTELKKSWEYDKKTLPYTKAPHLVFDAKGFADIILREYLKKDIEKVIVNSKEIYQRLNNTCSCNGIKLELSKDSLCYSRLDREMYRVSGRRLELKSGGFIVADKTEALVVFDVNTGNFSGKRSKEDTVLETNLEACREIARSIMLNNYSGIILIDFIDMDNQDNRTRVIQEMSLALSEDATRHKIYGITSLGLLEISRARRGKCLRDIIYKSPLFDRPSVSSLLSAIEGECERRSGHRFLSDLEIKLESTSARQAELMYPDFAKKLENKYGIRINIIPDPHISGYEVIKHVK